MKRKVFIGYATDDRKKRDTLRRVMKKMQCIEPIVIADRGKVGESLATKVERGINKADCLMPILTTNSIGNQWVNQEIGYAKAKDRKIIPLVDEEVLHKLKGFIHDQMDLSLQFKSYESNPEKEIAEFRKCCWDAVDQILADLLRINRPKGNKVKRQQVKVSGGGANPGDAIIVITSLGGRHLAPQARGVVADGDGNWQLERCNLVNPGDRLVYALAVRSSDEDRVRELLEQYRRPPTANAMDKFARILESEGIGFKLSPGKRLIRTMA